MIKGLFLASGYLPLIILYGPGNFDEGEKNRKLIGYTLLNLFWLILICCSFLSANVFETIVAIALIVSYPIVLAICGIYNRKHKKTSYTILGRLTDAKQISQEDKDNYIENKAPRTIIAFCEEHKGNDKEIYFYLVKNLRKGNLNQTKAEVIWEKYKTSLVDLSDDYNDEKKNIGRKTVDHRGASLKKGKIESFLNVHKKVILLLLVVCFTATVVGLIGYNICASNMRSALHHYDYIFEKWHTAGCGESTCEYCLGMEKQISKYTNNYGSPYEFVYYSDVSNIRMGFEAIGNISLVLTVVFLAFLLIAIIYSRKNYTTVNRQSNQAHSDNKKENQFCRYCGAKIKEDSSFCSSCGKKLI